MKNVEPGLFGFYSGAWPSSVSIRVLEWWPPKSSSLVPGAAAAPTRLLTLETDSPLVADKK